MNDKLWYKKPADKWNEGLPIGNGRLAAMVIGDPDRERIALNHEWLWRGINKDRDNKKRAQYLMKVRELLLEGEYEEGTLLANEAFGGRGGMSEEEGRIDPYQPVGDFNFELEHNQVNNYRRVLDLKKSLVTVSYETEKTTINQEIIADLNYNQIIVRISGEDKKLDGTFWLDRIEDPECKLSFNTDIYGKKNDITSTMNMKGIFKEQVKFLVEANIKIANGMVSHENNKLKIKNSREIIIFINIGTSVKGKEPSQEISQYSIPDKSWEKIKNDHINEMSKIYQSIKIDIDLPENKLPTDERLKEYRKGKKDPGLPLLYFNYGRYLLITSSIKGELPGNLQGKWNDKLRPPWSSDYHHDINLEMNYWCAESLNLEESVEPLFNFIERMVPHARKAAKDLYGCKGVWFPINTDAWCRATPECYGWSVWIGAAAWLAQHLWWHYEFGQNKEFLKERAYPFFKEVAEFYESYLIEDDDGKLQIVPSQSPENKFVGSGDLPISICVSSTMDIQLARAALGYALKSSEKLKIDKDKRKLWENMIEKLPEMKIGSKGQLLEWNQEFEEVEPDHRHLSHLWGLYPGDQITSDQTPELFDAARKSLEMRLEAGGGNPGWSSAWTACCFARLGDSKKAWEYIGNLIYDFASDNLFNLLHHSKFQIDGNLGGTAAIVEMLLHSHNNQLEFLPALPEEWSEGEIKGLRARGGYRVNIKWQNCRLQKAEIISFKDGICTVSNLDQDYYVQDASGAKVKFERNERKINFKVQSGKSYFIVN